MLAPHLIRRIATSMPPDAYQSVFEDGGFVVAYILRARWERFPLFTAFRRSLWRARKYATAVYSLSSTSPVTAPLTK